MNHSPRPQDDLFHAVNEEWLKNNQIPDEYSSWNNFMVLYDQSLHQQKAILEELQTSEAFNHNAELIKCLYSSGMNTEAIEKNGLKTINKIFTMVDTMKSYTDLSELMSFLEQNRMGFLFNISAEPDSKNSEYVVPHIMQSGLSLPDRDYYFQEDKKEIVEQLKEHINKMFQMVGMNDPTIGAQIFNLEVKFAEYHQTKVEQRDPHNIYHKISYSELKVLAPNIQWDVYLKFADGDGIYLVVDNP